MTDRLAGFVLAAGLGTRIGALSRLRPKPLLPIGSSTAFDRAVAALRLAGASRVFANASHLAEQIVARGAALDVSVSVEEGGPFGTAGGLSHAAIDADAVAIWNGDIVADLDVRALLVPGADAVLAVRSAPGRGNVGLAEDGTIVRLRETSIAPEARSAWFAAVQVLDRELVRAVPTRGCLVGDLLIPYLERGARLIAVETTGAWHDVGDLRSYLAANLAHPAVLGEIDPHVQLHNAVVGEGARVSGSGVLERVVVWPRAHAVAPLSSAVVTESSIVAVEGLDAVA
jgi:NDP-sugar pyrophosphorylase family protein